jgi:copper chaperone
MEVKDINVFGMSSIKCENKIKSAVGDLDGVKGVQVSLCDHKVSVAYDEDKVSLDNIKSTIKNQGYNVLR